jgi:hypothetical protein
VDRHIRELVPKHSLSTWFDFAHHEGLVPSTVQAEFDPADARKETNAGKSRVRV